jgi:hypothetical protein
MFGLNLFYIDERMLESLLRHIFKAISFNFDDRVRLRALVCIEQAFTEEELNEVMARTNQGRDESTADHGKSRRSDGEASNETKDILQGLRLNMNSNVIGEEKMRLEKKRL